MPSMWKLGGGGALAFRVRRVSCWTGIELAYSRMVALDKSIIFPLTVSNSGGDEVADSPRTCADR